MTSLRFRLDHHWAPGRLSAYLDGELTGHGAVRIERHTGLCPECHRVLRSLQELVGLLRAQPPAPEPAPATFVAAVRTEVARWTRSP